MKKYVAQDFVNALTKKMSPRPLPSCPYCGGTKFTSTDQLANIIIGETLEGISLGPNIPAGMVICENCGHMELFALGALGMLISSEEKDNGEKKQ